MSDAKEKLKALQLTIDKLEKTYGKGTVMKLSDEKVMDIPAISTGSLGLDIALGIGATARHLKDNKIERDLAMIMIAAGLPGVILGASFILQIPDQIAKTALGLLTMGLGIYSFFSPDLGQTLQLRNRQMKGYIIGGLVLFVIGILNGSLTSGTGLFVTLWLIRWFGLDYKLAVAYTLVFVGLFWNASGAVTLGLLGGWMWRRRRVRRSTGITHRLGKRTWCERTDSITKCVMEDSTENWASDWRTRGCWGSRFDIERCVFTWTTIVVMSTSKTGNAIGISANTFAVPE